MLHAKSIEEPCSTTAVTVTNTSMVKQQLSSGGTVTSQNGRTIIVALAEVVAGLKQHIPDLIPLFQEELLVTLYRVFSPASVMEKIPGNVS